MDNQLEGDKKYKVRITLACDKSVILKIGILTLS